MLQKHVEQTKQKHNFYQIGSLEKCGEPDKRMEAGSRKKLWKTQKGAVAYLIVRVSFFIVFFFF